MPPFTGQLGSQLAQPGIFELGGGDFDRRGTNPVTIHIADGYKIRLLRAKLPILTKLTLHLFQNTPNLIGTATVANFQESTFAGYSPKLLSCWGPPFIRADHLAEIDTCGITFICPGQNPGQFAYGWYCTDENGFFALGSYFTPGPVFFGPAPSSFTFTVRFLEDRIHEL